MGIYDRDYYRDEPRGFFLGGEHTVVAKLIFANVVVYLADQLLFDNHRLNEILALNSSLVQQPWDCWKLVTHAFAHDSGNFFHLLFNMLALWWFGGDVERIYGKRAFLQLYLSTAILAGLCWALSESLIFKHLDRSAVGASGAISGIMIVYVLHYPMRTFMFWGVIPMPVWLLATIYLAQDFLSFNQSLTAGENTTRIAYAAHLGGALFGLIYYKTGFTLFSWIPARFFKLPARGRPRLRVHSPEQDERELSDRVDEILQKISREGEASLTRAERRTLEEASRRYQKRRG